MKLALAESVADKLAKDNDVLDTEVQRDGDVSILATVPNEHARRRVKSTLHQYPLYVELEVGDV